MDEVGRDWLTLNLQLHTIMNTPKSTLDQLSESVAINGRWSTRSIRAGKRIWRKSDKDKLDAYILGLGFRRDTEEFYAARFELILQVESLIRDEIYPTNQMMK